MPRDATATPRADRLRNRERLLRAAMEVVARDGAQASMEEIARRAGVGSATLHRHFASRRVLLEAVFADGVDTLCARAEALCRAEPATALWVWLDEFVQYVASARGMVEVLLAEPSPEAPVCHSDRVCAVARPLVAAAAAAGGLHPDARPEDVVALTAAVSTAAGEDPAAARRLLRLTVEGLRTSGCGRTQA
ncbi:TetR/AcrR family transcriptional regulator [Pseudonocardia sp. HH130629-09]|uniref:TetR/AcrR family transcriptional regulator n=1 Tax=Pseudonocardia sp. HH130629-09 TaxID=1641402 RepID=UPI0006CB589C|nr:TetR/AcrR family transcriptional regulator [Pseudonocardia sp. HH130629-09]ALE82206.1 hypothetical protein XF36_02860 [Pseudonocardia sp. HH130629-09]